MNKQLQGLFLQYALDESDCDEWLSDTSSDLELENIEVRSKRVRISEFMDVITKYSDEEFRKHFRLHRTTASTCIEELEVANVLPSHLFGLEKVSPRKAFLMTLWYLANEETYRQVSDRFGVSESTAWSVTKKVIDYLVDKSKFVIKWPTLAEANIVASEFAQKHGIEGVIGAIDGTHILINRKGADQQAYCNRKGTHSIILQVVVDSYKRFINVFAGEAGSLHDARVFKRSGLYHNAVNGTLPFYNKFLLGDSAYPTYLPWLITPYKDNGNLNRQQRSFNYKHSATRVVVENAIGLLKGRFRRLRHFDNKSLTFVTKASIAACVLHNICIDSGDIEYDVEILPDDADIQDCHDMADNLLQGTARRDEICMKVTT